MVKLTNVWSFRGCYTFWVFLYQLCISCITHLHSRKTQKTRIRKITVYFTENELKLGMVWPVTWKGKKFQKSSNDTTSVFKDLKHSLHISLPAGYCTSKSTEHHCKTLSFTRVSTECSVRESCLNQFSCKPPNQKTYYSKYCRQIYVLSSVNSTILVWGLFAGVHKPWVLTYLMQIRFCLSMLKFWSESILAGEELFLVTANSRLQQFDMTGIS